MGDNTYKKVIRDEVLKIIGDKILARNITAWMSNSIFTDIPSSSEI